MRDLPADISIQPLPADFTVQIMDDDRSLSWSGEIAGAPGRYEIGLRPLRGPQDLAQAREYIRTGVWQLMECARLQRFSLMAYASTQRHRDRPRRQAR